LIELNEEQQAAANFFEEIAAVIAVPGSGKTLTMAARIAILVKKHGVAPSSILGVTFTRSAAQTMRERLVSVLNDQASNINLMTLHSFCHLILRSEKRAFEILSGQEQIVFVKKISQKLRIRDVSTGMALREISLAKNNLVRSEEFEVLHESDKTMVKVGRIYKAYEEEKAKRLMLDFDDLLFETYRLLSENEEVRNKYRETFRHVLCDEYQDTNPAQLEILKLLINDPVKESSFFVVGDDWQSIFGFIGSNVTNLTHFSRMFPNSQFFVLTENYRSTPQIIKACRNLIMNNTRRIEKPFQTRNEDGEEVTVLQSGNEDAEALSVVTEIQDLTSRKGYRFNDIAVLFRCNFQSRYFEEAFRRFNVLYQIENGLPFFHRPEVKVFLDYLTLIVDPSSDRGDQALLAIANVPLRYFGKTFFTELEEFALKKEIHFYEALKSAPIQTPYLRKFVKEFLNLMDPLIQEGKTIEPAEVIGLLRSTLDLDRVITENDIPSPDDTRIQNIDQVQLAAKRFGNIQSFLSYTDTFERDPVKDKEGVILSTVHKAKGLEFPIVFFVGLVMGLTPSKKGNVEEERRIAFVACSRAMKKLYLSYSLQYLGQGAERSLFVDEILRVKKPTN
jgi:DNA helicase-2/ATP-dependent DNA helicase PcrA